MHRTSKFLRHPIDYEINGRKCVLLTVGHLANALHRSPWTVRHWTRLGILPEAPFDLDPNEPRLRKRLYPKPFVDALAAITEDKYSGPRLDRHQWQQFQHDVWAAYQETVMPLTCGVSDGGSPITAADDRGQAIGHLP